MRDNPAALIVNRGSYDLIGAHFAPQRFDRPQVTRVATFSMSQEQTARYFLIDGNTRTKYVNDHSDEIAKDHPGFVFEVRDVTEALLSNPRVVLPEERGRTKGTLTMLQYLRAVVPPTIEHSQIAPDRIAAHLINGWDVMVGDELAQKFSALAAFSFLRNSRVPIATTDMLKRFLSSPEKLVANETPDERALINKALLEMASIIQQSKLSKEQVALAAFMLASSNSPVIGAAQNSRLEVYGLLNTPIVDKKLAEGFKEAGEREQQRAKLGQVVLDAFARAAKLPNSQRVLNTLDLVLKDPSLPIKQTIEVLTANSPEERFAQISQEVNKLKLASAYAARSGRYELSDSETQLLNKLGSVTYLADRDVPVLAQAVQEASGALQAVDTFVRELTDENSREALIAAGVQPKVLDDIRVTIDTYRKATIASSAVQVLSRNAKALAGAFREARGKVDQQKLVHKIGGLVDEVYKDELTDGFAPQVRQSIVYYLLRETNDEAQRRVILEKLHGLDKNLQAQVVRGDIRLQRAFERQTQTFSNFRTPRVEPRTRYSAPQRSIRRQPEVVGLAAPAEVVYVDKGEADARRKEVNNTNLREALTAFVSKYQELDLEHSELEPDTKSLIDQAFNLIGRLRFEHPDVVRIIEQEYPRLMAESRQALEAKVQLEQEEITRNTQTRQ